VTDRDLVAKKLAPRSRRELVDLLQHAGWIPADLAEVMRGMVVEHELDDLLRFRGLIRSRLA
jgi:hypothetical protein